VTNKEQYILFSQLAEIPLQMQPWWLDAVCGTRHWDVCLSFNKEGRIVGALPYYYLHKHGISRVTMPPMTDYMGPWIGLPNKKELKKVSRYSIESHILKDLVQQLPEKALFYQTYFPELTNSLPFTWKGYRTTVYYTYRLNTPLDKDQVFDDFKYTVRTEIRKAIKQVQVESTNNLDIFHQIHNESFKRKGIKPAVDLETLKSIDEQIAARSQRQIWLARDMNSGKLHAGVYTVQDAKMLYILLTGIDPVLKSSGALYLLYWQAIQYAIDLGLGVDFCGSMLPGVESSIRSMGGDRHAYFCVSKTKHKLLAVLNLLLGKAY
jgi:hypothetical protein